MLVLRVPDSNLLELFSLAGRLKKIPRTGWLERGVKGAESVADHSFRLSFMAFVLAGELGLDSGKCVKMALIHDLPEALVGDLASRVAEADQEVSNREKARLEGNAMKKILALLPAPSRKEVGGLWKEFCGQKSAEAKLVKDLDKLEMALQALEYEGEGNHAVPLQEFFDYASAKVKTARGRRLLEEIISLRRVKKKK